MSKAFNKSKFNVIFKCYQHQICKFILTRMKLLTFQASKVKRTRNIANMFQLIKS